jgi:hypothetical protein
MLSVVRLVSERELSSVAHEIVVVFGVVRAVAVAFADHFAVVVEGYATVAVVVIVEI